MQAGPDGPAPDMARMLSGHPESMQMPPPPALPEGPWLWLGAATNTAFAGPWGITYAPNLTPDSTTGLPSTHLMLLGFGVRSACMRRTVLTASSGSDETRRAQGAQPMPEPSRVQRARPTR